MFLKKTNSSYIAILLLVIGYVFFDYIFHFAAQAGVRFSFEDGSWGLIRASSNKPSLVIVTESPTSDVRKKKIFDFIDDLLQKTGKVGKYDQKI